MVHIGIDVGTAACRVGGPNEGGVDLLQLDGATEVPTVVGFPPGDGSVVVGEAALDRLPVEPETTAAGFVREVGTGDWTVGVDGEDDRTEYTPAMLLALVLRRVVDEAETALGEPVDDAVLAVPSSFGPREREAVTVAAALADLEVQGLLAAPTAAAAAFSQRGRSGVERVAVLDLGAGTFDAGVLAVDYAQSSVEVEATTGDRQLGGLDLDERLADYLAAGIEDDVGVDVRGDPQQMAALRREGRRVKEELTMVEESDAAVGPLPGGEVHEQTVTRETFEALAADLVDEVVEGCDGLLAAVGVQPDEVDVVLPVGGSSRIPSLRAAIEDYFGTELASDVDPVETVARGAGGVAGGGPGPNVTPALTTDVGLELFDDQMDVLLASGTPLPASETLRSAYRTVEDGQTEAVVRLLQGGADVASDNDRLGEFLVENIPEAPAGEVTLTLDVAVDEDAILTVDATEDAISDGDVVTVQRRDATPGLGSTSDLEAVRDELPDVG